MLVTAIVSTYNSEEFIRGCLENLENQTMADRLEIIVVNSGSTQDEESVVKEFQDRYSNIVYVKTKERETIYKAWNRAVKRARGKYITNANTDDRHRNDALEVMVDRLESEPYPDLVYGWQWLSNISNRGFEDFVELDVDRWPESVRETMKDYLNKTIIRKVRLNERTGYHFCWPAYSRTVMDVQNIAGPQPMWRREVHDKIGYFDTAFEIGGDYEFWLRMVNAGYTLRLIPEILGVFYLGGLNKEFTDDKQLWLERLWRARKYLKQSPRFNAVLGDILYHLMVLEPGNGDYRREIGKLLQTGLPGRTVYRIASFYKQKGRYDTAIQWFSRVLEEAGEPGLSAGAHFHLGEMDMIRGNREAARGHFEKTAALNPSHLKAAEYLQNPDSWEKSVHS